MSAADTTDRCALLVLGGLHHLNGATPSTPDDVLVTAPLRAPLEEAFPSNTIVLRWADHEALELRGRRGDGAVATATAAGADILPDMLPGPALLKVFGQLGEGPLAGPPVPLFYVSARRDHDTWLVHAYVQIRCLAEDACFIRVTPEPIRVADPEALEWLPEALDLHRRQVVFHSNHQRYYRKCFPGQELEHKYTLIPPVDVWTATVELQRRLRRGELAGYIMEYRDEFQAWDYENHLFQITGPPDQRGYVSFIPTTDGRNLVKQKWFDQDAFQRRESHTYGVDPREGYAVYIRDDLELEARALPGFRRVRYDVNFESVRTGHVYGIFFDHVSLLDAPDVVLSQCELEYLRSRTSVPPDEGAVLEEIADIAGWLETYLDERGLASERGTYSKLSFLLDTVAARPELAAEVV